MELDVEVYSPMVELCQPEEMETPEVNYKGNWVKLHRKLLRWEWFTDANTLQMFIYLLISANHKTSVWRGVVLERGQLLTGRKKIATALHRTEQQVKTSLEHLKLTNEITIKATSKFSIVTIQNYNRYQIIENGSNQQSNQQKLSLITNKSSHQQPTKAPIGNHIQESKELKESKEYKEVNTPAVPSGTPTIKVKHLKKVFSPEGKKQYLTHVYLSQDQAVRVKNYFNKHGLSKDDIHEAIKILDDWLDKKELNRKNLIDDARAITGWVFKELLDRKAKQLRLQREESMTNGGWHKV